jgi:lambda family phage portal protein
MSPIKDWPYQLQLQLVEADRVCNAENVADTKNLSGGIKKNDNGAPIEYHIAKSHPGNSIVTQNEWNIIKAFGSKTGRKNVLHIYHKRRIGQSRGVPDLAPVIEILKQLGRYTESELAATVISSFFTVFIKSEQTAGFAPMQPIADIGGSTADKDFKMGSGAMLDLAPNESTEIANPARPNTSFDPFVLALSRQIGTALELPFEILVKHFTASYSAARAALLEAWRYFMGRRKWLADSLCRPVYELWLTEQVASGRIAAPGYLQDPLIRSAYLSSEWIGPAAGQIDELKSVKAARERVNGGFSTESSETVGLTGGDWELDHVQRAKEVRKRREDGLIEEDLTKTGVTENGKDAYMVSN